MALLLAAGAGQGADPHVPQGLVTAGLKVHVRAHESLDPDLLRGLARPNVTLWLDTTSNTLKTSTIENLARFDDAYVRVRAPMKEVDARVFARAPAVGLWVDDRIGREVVGRVPGARRVAVRVDGALTDERARAIAALRPAVVEWRPGAPPSLLEWALLRQLGGRRVARLDAGQYWPMPCGQRRADEPSVEVHVAVLEARSSDVYPCSAGTRVVVPSRVEESVLRALVQRDPSVELVVHVGDDAREVARLRVVLDLVSPGKRR